MNHQHTPSTPHPHLHPHTKQEKHTHTYIVALLITFLELLNHQKWNSSSINWYRKNQTIHEYNCIFNTLRSRQNSGHFPDIFKCIFLNEYVWISIKISLKYVPRGPINNIPALVQIMAWRRQGDKPLSEPMMVRLLTHICVTRPQWVNILQPTG